ncbi:MAG: hypothetical protein AB7O32_00175 [Vicinamibacterales bacterium]
MAIGAALKANPEFKGTFTAAGASASRWVTVIDAGGAATADNGGTVTNPTSQITLASRHPLTRDANGPPTLRVRFGYDDGATSTQDPKLVVWGRKKTGDNSEAWQRLYNKDPSPTTEVELTIAESTDAEDGTLKYTAPDPRTHAYDVDGCDEFRFQISLPFTATGGLTTTNCIVQAKLV